MSDGVAEDQIPFAARRGRGGIGAEAELGEGEAVPVGEIDGDPMVSLG